MTQNPVFGRIEVPLWLGAQQRGHRTLSGRCLIIEDTPYIMNERVHAVFQFSQAGPKHNVALYSEFFVLVNFAREYGV
jgi:hypothetical protein